MISAEFSDKSVILHLDVERIEMNMVRALRKEVLSNLNDHPSPVRLDMSGVTSIDSAGLGTLKLLSDEISDYGGRMTIMNVRRPLMMLFKISKLDAFFQFEEGNAP